MMQVMVVRLVVRQFLLEFAAAVPLIPLPGDHRSLVKEDGVECLHH